LPDFGKFIIICGHYGCGKTNFSLNLACKLAGEGRAVTLVDLDIVNPYFRSSDYEDLLQKQQIRLIAPVYARSNLDSPSLPAEIQSIFVDDKRTVIIDVGGDDAGATALGRFSGEINALPGGYQMFYLVNRYRMMTEDTAPAVELLREIEQASHLTVTGVVNNSHLQGLTKQEDILRAIPYGCACAKALGLPLIATTAPRFLVASLTDRVEALYPIDIFVRPPWETGADS
jgi:hypothetical protein